MDVDVSVDDPAFWSKVGFVAKKASAANLGERKRKAVERMGMGEEWVDDEAEDDHRQRRRHDKTERKRRSE